MSKASKSRRHQGGTAAVCRPTSVILCRRARQRSAAYRVALYPRTDPAEADRLRSQEQSLETVTELSILDRIKVSSHVGYNVFGTASAFWQDRINA